MRVRVTKQQWMPGRMMRPLMWLLLMFYMGYHALHGERGVYALMRDRRELAQLEQALAETKSQREQMEIKVSHLRNDSLDRDLLDEQMRRMMGVMGKGELVVLQN